MNKEFKYQSNINYYWIALFCLILGVLAINIFIIKDFNRFSFELYFLMMIPVWFGVLGINNYETNKIKRTLREYLEKYYPDKLREYDQKPVELLNSDTEDILDLFHDQELIKDPSIKKLCIDFRQISRFMYAVFFTLPLLLGFSVFVILK